MPTSLEVGGVGRPIRTDFRIILDLLTDLSDPQYENDEKALIFLIAIYPEYADIPPEFHQEAIDKAVSFIDMGISSDNRKNLSLMNWEKDAPIIFPAVNRVIGGEARFMEYLHWWTFLGAYMEIGESLFSSVLGIREKLAKGKKLEKYETEFYRSNKHLIDLERKNNTLSSDEKDKLYKLFGIKKKT